MLEPINTIGWSQWQSYKFLGLAGLDVGGSCSAGQDNMLRDGAAFIISAHVLRCVCNWRWMWPHSLAQQTSGFTFASSVPCSKLHSSKENSRIAFPEMQFGRLVANGRHLHSEVVQFRKGFSLWLCCYMIFTKSWGFNCALHWIDPARRAHTDGTRAP